MPVIDLLRLAVRLWYVTLVGLVVTAALLAWVDRRPGVYYSQVDVLFTAPQSVEYPNKLSVTSQNLITTAGVVARAMGVEGSAGARASGPVTLTGRGVVDGETVTLPDAGGQWAHNFDRQVLDVEVAGPSEADVRSRQAALVARISRTAQEVQDSQGVAPENRITVEPSAPVPSLVYERGNPHRAMGMIVVLGAAATATALSAVERLRRGRGGGARPVLARWRRARPPVKEIA